jgi:site-specific DNA-methyltransferase (adenine-specific)
MTRPTTPDVLGEKENGKPVNVVSAQFGGETGQQPNALARLSRATRMLSEAKTLEEFKDIRDTAKLFVEWAKARGLGQDSMNDGAEIKLRAEREMGALLAQSQKEQGARNDLTLSNNGQSSEYRAVLEETNTTRQDANRMQTISELAEEAFEEWLWSQRQARQEITTAGALRLAKQLKREQAKNAYPEPAPLADKQPILIVGKAEELIEIGDETVNVIVTSPPYNMGGNHWDMGNRGSRESGIGYDDNLPEQEYQDWQRSVLRELYRVATPGASLFYNHKVRIRNGQAILPTDWVRKSGWILRQVIVWDRGSTHNHETRLFWPHDEWVLWLTKGKPDLHHPINMPSIWQFHGPVAGTWHPAPFAEELPRRCLQAVGYPGCVVLDPFAGSCTTVKVALEMGYDAIGVDVSEEYLQKARLENGW